MENYLKGLTYEKHIKTHLLTNNNQVYLWNDIPLDIFISSKIFENYENKLLFRRRSTDDAHNVTDTGCDILYYDEKIKQWIIVQCKNYTVTVTLDKLAGFYDLLLSTGLSGELYYTSRLSEPITRYKKKMIRFNHHPTAENNNIKNDYKKLVPYDYQINAINKLKLHKRSILHLPCGMGKTLIAIKWSEQFDIIIIFSPLKQHAQQNLERFKNELDNYDNYILVDSDGERDINNIKKSINKKIILSATYKSVDVISELIKYINKKKVGVVVDEFHNLTYDNIFDKMDIFNKVLTENFNYLFVSATPRIFDSEDEYANNEQITGKIEYTYEFGKAIKNNYICDYDVFVPDVSVPKDDLMKDVYGHLKITDKTKISDDVKAQFLLRCMEENGHSKCICYARDIEDAQNLMNSFNKIKDYHAIDLYIKLIIADTSKKERDTILNEFQETHTKAIICSVRILDECIDIPKCDSIFMTSSQTNKIRMIQRVCRANRKNKESPNKKSGIYMWADEYNQLTEIIASLKEADSSFTKEKVKICNTKNEKQRCIIDRKDNGQYIILDKVIVETKHVGTWGEKLEKLRKFFVDDERKPSPSATDKYENQLATWIYTQTKNSKNRTKIMKSDEIYNKWCTFVNDYYEYFKTNEEDWHDKFDEMKKYIDDNKQKPSQDSKDEDISRMGHWISRQIKNSKNRTKIMKSDEIYNKWNTFYNEYYKYFMSNEERWHNVFDNVKKYINENKCRPPEDFNDGDSINLAKWITQQNDNYKNKKNIMNSSDEIYNKWGKFVNEHKQYFMTYEEEWRQICDELKKYIDEHKCKPSEKIGTEKEKSLMRWLYAQINNSKTREYIMKSDDIYNEWCTFADEYKDYIYKRRKRTIVVKGNKNEQNQEQQNVSEDVTID